MDIMNTATNGTATLITDHDVYIDTLLGYGRPYVLHMCRMLRVRAGSIKDTRAICELLWNITNVNRTAAIRRAEEGR